MREQIKQDIDLIEILFYLKKKIRVILFIIAICMAMVLLFLYINKDNIKVSYSLKINQTTPGILVNCDSNNNFACQTTMTEDVIQRITTFFHTSPDVKNREIKLEWSGDKRDLPTAEAEISRVQASIIKWYASEYHNGRQVLDEIQTPSAINSELYTKMNRPGFPGECFICELRLPDHRFRWKHNKLFLLLPVGYGPAFPAIVDCYTSPPT